MLSSVRAQVVFLAAFICAPLARPATVVDLGTLGGATSHATGVNASGQVVGSSSTAAGTTDPFLYTGGIMTDLGSPGVAYGINNSGQIVGGANSQPFLYSNGQLTYINPGPNSAGLAINNSGQIAGVFGDYPTISSFLYSNGVTTVLPISGYINYASGINDSGQVVGGPAMQGLYGHYAYLYSGGVLTYLGSLGGSYSAALGINNAGQIVGGSYLEQVGVQGEHAFLYSNGVMQDLGSLEGPSVGGYSIGYGINNAGEVVGFSAPLNDQQDSSAFLYANGVMTDLNTLLPANSGWDLTSANAINDFGQIVGDGIINGQQHAFLLDTAVTSTPEPNSLLLFSAGIASLLLTSSFFGARRQNSMGTYGRPILRKQRLQNHSMHAYLAIH